MTKYLATIQFDCNDADYVYGVKVITEKQKEMIDRNGNKKVSFGSCDFGEAERTVDECITVQKITDEEAKMLKKLGLAEFGESFYPEELDGAEDDDEEEEEEDED